MNKEFIYIVSDQHITVTKPVARKEKTDEEWLLAQKDILLQVKAIVGKDLLLNCGDLIDTGKPYRSQTIVNLLVDTAPVNMVMLHGNHELYGFAQDVTRAMKEGTLGNLTRSKKLQYLADDTEFNWGKFTIYPFNFKANKTIEHREVDPTRVNIAAGHFLSYDANELPFYVKEDKGWLAKDIIEEFPEFDLFTIGDNHASFVVQDKYLSPGSMTRRHSSQMKHKPCIWKYDGETLEPIYLDVSDAEEVLSREHNDAAKDKKERSEDFMSSVGSLNAETNKPVDIKEGFKDYFNSDKETRANVPEMIWDLVGRVEENRV